MANIYLLEEGGDFLKPGNHKKVDTTPYILLTSKEEFAIAGIKFLLRGTHEFAQYESDFRKKLEKLRFGKKKSYTEKQIEEIMTKRSLEDHVASTPFYAIHYSNVYPRKWEKRLIGDEGLKIVGEVCPNSKRIDFFHSDLPNDMLKKAKWCEEYRFDGNLEDAMEEFERNGFSFNIFDCVWTGYRIEGEERTPNVMEEKLTEKVSLQEVFEFGKTGLK